MTEEHEAHGSLTGWRPIAAQWFAVLAGPLAWALGLNAGYAFVRVACVRDSMLPLHLVSLFTLLLALAGGLVAHGIWRRTGEEGPGEGGGALSRSRFMGLIGLLASGLFSLAIIAQWVAVLFLDPCMGI